jgi:hypothetical protein
MSSTASELKRNLRGLSQALGLQWDLVKLVRWEYDVEIDMFAFDDQFCALYGTTANEKADH